MSTEELNKISMSCHLPIWYRPYSWSQLPSQGHYNRQASPEPKRVNVNTLISVMQIKLMHLRLPNFTKNIAIGNSTSLQQNISQGAPNGITS